MADILSQSEIDSLLKTLQNEDESQISDISNIDNTQNVSSVDNGIIQNNIEIKERNIRTYDFRRPSRFAKEHLKTIHIIHENYARLITNYLSGYLRTLVQVEVGDVEPQAYYEFSNNIPNPGIIAIVAYGSLPGSVIMEIDPKVAYALIDRILGGKGTLIEKVRGLTEVELAIIERIVMQLLNLMDEPWENIIKINPKLEKIETNPQFAQIISPNEIIALISFNTKIGDVEGIINLCIPHMVLEPIVSKLSTKYWFSSAEKKISEDLKIAIETKLESTKVPVRAILGSTNVLVSEFGELQVGDVISLDTNIGGNLEVLIGDLLKFHAKPGIRKNRVSIKILDVLNKEDE